MLTEIWIDLRGGLGVTGYKTFKKLLREIQRHSGIIDWDTDIIYSEETCPIYFSIRTLKIQGT